MDETPRTRPSLIVRLRDPTDEVAWGEFLEVYGPLVHRLARLKGFQDADADDLTQDVFRAVAAAIDRFDPDPSLGSFRGWLSTIARNLMLNLLDRRQSHPIGVGVGGTDLLDLLDAMPHPGTSETALYDEEHRRRLFRWAADRVRPEFREPTWRAFWMTSIDGIAPAEVAASLGQTVGSVYIARSRVLARLRAVIDRVEGR